MAEKNSSSAARSGGRTLADRVRARVDDASRSVDRRTGAARPSSRKPRAGSKSALSQGDAAAREQTALRMVFRDLGDTHRQYRARTGHTGTAPLREAAHAFKNAPSFTSLVAVSVFFDELGLLAW
jgi:hypothetical protein